MRPIVRFYPCPPIPNYETLINSRLRIKEVGFKTPDKLLSMEQAKEFVDTAHKMNKSVILVEGTWDLTHAGHVQHVEEATKHANLVLLRLASSKYARTYKGEGRPIEEYRDIVVSEFENVDAVLMDQTVIDPEDIPENAQILADLNPDMLALETEDDKFQLKMNALEYANNSLGVSIKPVVMTLNHLNSTTEIINKIRGTNNADYH